MCTGLRPCAIAALVLLVSGCGGTGGSGNATSIAPQAYAIVANVSGLSGSGLAIAFDTAAPVDVSGNGATTLATGLTTGAPYSVTIATQPINPVQTCSVTGGSGTVSGANVNVAVSCVAGTPATVNAAQATVSIDASVPTSAISLITTIVSPLDSEPLGTPLYVPISAAGGDTLVLAVDANNDIMLASLTNSNVANLSASTTALALVRLAMGALPSNSVSSQVNAAIRITTEFPNLVSLISSALEANTSPVTSSSVYSSIATVLRELPASVVTTLQASQTRVRVAHATPVASPSITSSMPYELVNFSTPLPQSVSVTGAVAATGNLQVSNSTLIAWALASATTSGSNLCLPGGAASSTNPDCSVIIPQTSVLGAIGSLYGSSAVSTGIIEGDGGGSFNLVLEQNLLTHASNVTQIFKDLIFTLAAFETGSVSASAGKQCLESITDALLPASEVATLALNPSGAAVEAYLGSVFSKSTLFTLIAGNCASTFFPSLKGGSAGSWTFAQAVTAFVLGLSKFAASEISAAATAVGIPAEIYWTVSYWPYGKDTFGVCEADNPPPNLVISNCALSFAFTPAAVTLVPGDSFTPTIGTSPGGVTPALNAYLGAGGSGATTLVPPDLGYSSPQNGSVIDLDSTTGKVDALPLSSGQSTAEAIITVTETSTGLAAQYSINVSSLPTVTLTANPMSVPSSGGSVTLTATLAPPTGAIPGSPTPTGMVTFTDTTGAVFCAQPVTVQAGVASCVATVTAGPDDITANYGGSGDGTYTSVISNPVTISVASAAVGWTHMTGSSTECTTSPCAGTPPPREGAVGWVDKSGNLWLYGGGQIGTPLEDLWEYVPATGQWTEIASSGGPGTRDDAVSWTDGSGNFWLFGGSVTGMGEAGDLWKYVP